MFTFTLTFSLTLSLLHCHAHILASTLALTLLSRVYMCTPLPAPACVALLTPIYTILTIPHSHCYPLPVTALIFTHLHQAFACQTTLMRSLQLMSMGWAGLGGELEWGGGWKAARPASAVAALQSDLLNYA
jgi:hypothetical protein